MARNAVEFKFDVADAMKNQLHDSLEGLSVAPLTQAEVNRVKVQSGVYSLLRKTGPGVFETLYVGKSDGDLRSRLAKHRHKIAGRLNLNIKDFYFRCLYIPETWDAMSPEKLLISVYKLRTPRFWNGLGVGNNDPGGERDGTTLKSSHFDMQYPIDLDYPCQFIPGGHYSCEDLLMRLKEGLPYLLRYQPIRKGRELLTRILENTSCRCRVEGRRQGPCYS